MSLEWENDPLMKRGVDDPTNPYETSCTSGETNYVPGMFKQGLKNVVRGVGTAVAVVIIVAGTVACGDDPNLPSHLNHPNAADAMEYLARNFSRSNCCGISAPLNAQDNRQVCGEKSMEVMDHFFPDSNR